MHAENSMSHIIFTSEADHIKAVFRGHVQCWGGPGGLVKHIRLPDRTMRYRKWRTPPYLCEESRGFGHHNIDHTFQWRKPVCQQDIRIEIKLSGKVGFLTANRQLAHILKPYEYSREDIHPLITVIDMKWSKRS